MATDYQEKIDWLFNQFPAFQKVGNTAYRPNLSNSLSLIEFFNVPLKEMKFIHVAGTNGKGTTSSILASFYTEAKFKTGLFTSPHIKDFKERIRINGEKIPAKKVIGYINKLQSAPLDFLPSFFEITWAIALSYFYEKKCDIIIVETGLGGRLDATNIIMPEISIITNIGLDHIAILGNTKRQIAAEKAGIIKKNIPVIIGESDEGINDVFINTALEKNAPVYFAECQTENNVFDKNKKLAFAAIDIIQKNSANLKKIKSKAIENLWKNTGLYGRNQIFNKNPLIIIDAAHNAMGVKNFIAEIQKKYTEKKIRVLYGASNDKNINEIIQLFPNEWEYYITEFKNKRTTKIEQFKSIEKLNTLKAGFFYNAKTAFKKAQNTDNKIDIILVFGSFYLLEEII